MNRSSVGFPFKIMAVMLLSALLVLLLSTTAFASIYQRGSATSYADQFATSYNINYNNYSEDCTNFTSQALFQGQLPMVGQYNNVPTAWWYNFNGGTHSNTWTVASNQYSFIILNTSPHWGNVASSYLSPSSSYPSGVSPGDLFYYDWDNDSVIDHSAIYAANGTDPDSGSTGAL